MTKGLIDIAEEAFASTALKDTVNTALAEDSAVLRRRRALSRLHQRALAGQFDDTYDKNTYRPNPTAGPAAS
ncbi:hypothetical protein ACH35V_00400 [Actinomadura sp. 1N219]|uniref:hypothetical protein n=1 Tax=Actinomadura sp. 1N219 TaxID=3375152 RepID=UPI0037A52B72